jgi:hypothetical protein
VLCNHSTFWSRQIYVNFLFMQKSERIPLVRSFLFFMIAVRALFPVRVHVLFTRLGYLAGLVFNPTKATQADEVSPSNPNSTLYLLP